MLAVSGRHVIGQVNVNILYITLFQRQKTVAKKNKKYIQYSIFSALTVISPIWR